MATIQLFISDTPLCFEKAEFTFMEERFVIEKQQLFEKVDAVIQIDAPIQHEEVIALPALLRDYHGTLRLTFEKFYEYLV